MFSLLVGCVGVIAGLLSGPSQSVREGLTLAPHTGLDLGALCVSV